MLRENKRLPPIGLKPLFAGPDATPVFLREITKGLSFPVQPENGKEAYRQKRKKQSTKYEAWKICGGQIKENPGDLKKEKTQCRKRAKKKAPFFIFPFPCPCQTFCDRDKKTETEPEKEISCRDHTQICRGFFVLPDPKTGDLGKMPFDGKIDRQEDSAVKKTFNKQFTGPTFLPEESQPAFLSEKTANRSAQETEQKPGQRDDDRDARRSERGQVGRIVVVF